MLFTKPETVADVIEATLAHRRAGTLPDGVTMEDNERHLFVGGWRDQAEPHRQPDEVLSAHLALAVQFYLSDPAKPMSETKAKALIREAKDRGEIVMQGASVNTAYTTPRVVQEIARAKAAKDAELRAVGARAEALGVRVLYTVSRRSLWGYEISGAELGQHPVISIKVGNSVEEIIRLLEAK